MSNASTPAVGERLEQDAELRGDCGFTLPQPHTARPYMSARQLAEMTPWTVNAIRKMRARGILKLGVHYFRPLGRGREVVFKWSAIVAMIEQQPPDVKEAEPMRQYSRSTSIDVEQATANFERLLG